MSARDDETSRHDQQGVDVGAVVWGLVLIAVPAAIVADVAFAVVWDWRWTVAAVLLLAGGSVVLASVVGALRTGRGGGSFPP